MKYLFIVCLLLISGCGIKESQDKREAKREAVAKEEAERPDRLKIVSQRKTLGNYTTAVVVEDKETGQKFIIVEGSYGDAVAITPIKKDER